MKIFITGGSGLLGQYLNIELSKYHTILTQYHLNPGNCVEFNNVRLDLTNSSSLKEVFSDFNPDIVLHIAAISNPQLAEKIDSKTVYAINVKATEQLAQLCEIHNTKLIYTSTDLVYAGYRSSMLKEDAKLIPVSLYAETKLIGEVKIQDTFNDYIILRTALLFGFGLNHSTNHFHQMYQNLKNGKEVKLFTDQYRTPLSVIDAARMINQLIQKDIKTEILNFGGKERVSRYELGEILCEVAGFDKNLLVKITMDDLPGLNKVEDVSMNTDRLQSFGIKSISISGSIEKILNEI
jgi:dTDP-4-dehydrorhamnose reductase